MIPVDIIVKAQDAASQVFKKVGGAGKVSGDLITKHWKTASVALGTAGVALEALSRKVAPLREQSQVLAAQLGKTTDEIRELAIATADVTRPLDQVLETFKTAREQGLETEEQLQSFAVMWDTVGDATKENAAELAKAGIALSGMGIAIDEQVKAMPALDFVFKNTSMRVGEFLTFIERTGPELREMGFDINDAAAMVGLLQKEFGMSARMARTEFTQAVAESDGTMKGLLSTLNVSQEVFDGYKQSVIASSGAIQQAADIHADSYTIIQKVQHAVSELTLRHSDLIMSLSSLAPLLIAAGPMIRGLQLAYNGLALAASKALIPALITLKSAFIGVHIAGGPLLWILEGLILAIVVFAVAWHKNWGNIQEKVVDALNSIGDSLVKGANFFLETTAEWINKAIELFNKLPGAAIEYEATFGQIGKDWSLKLGDGFKEGMDLGLDKIKEAVDKVKNVVPGAEEAQAQGKEFTENVAAGIKLQAEESETLVEAGKAVAETAKESIVEEAPVFEEIGYMVPDSIATGIESGVGVVGDAIENLTNQMESDLTSGVQSAVNQAFEISGEALEGFDWDDYYRGLAGATARFTYQPQQRSIFGFQHGGIVRKPTMGIVGEAGPEAVIPLNKAGGLGGAELHVHLNNAIFTTDEDYRTLTRKLFDFFETEQRRRGLA